MTAQSLQFKMHPSLISSIINEQSGKPEKAIAELVMNSADAGATEVHITLSAKHYSVKDNGSGFSGREEIEKFFGTFGTPHWAGDGAKFGRFRMGRGVCFSLSKTEWRSGMYGMTVNLGGLSRTDVHGYQLHEYSENFEGCLIEGQFYQPLSAYAGLHSPSVFDEKFNEDLKAFAAKPSYEIMQGKGFCHSLLSYICMMDLDIYINGIKVSRLLSYTNNVYSGDLVDIYTEKNAKGLVLMNQGVYIQTIPFAVPFIIDFKQAPALNMARNQLDASCPIYKSVKQDFFDFLVKAYVKGQKFAVKVEKILFNYVYNNYSHFEREFIEHITGEKLLQILGAYKVIKVTATESEKISFLDAFDLIAEKQVYLSNYEQCNGLTASKVSVFQNQLSMSAESQSELHILDLNRIMVYMRGVVGGPRLHTLLSDSGRNVGHLAVSENWVVDEFADLKIGRISSRHLKEQTQDNDSLLALLERVDALWDKEIEVNKTYFRKKEKRMKQMELEVREYVESLRNFYVEVTGDENKHLNLFKDIRIIPLVVENVTVSYRHRARVDTKNLTFFELTENEVCMFVPRMRMGDFMNWIGPLNHFLFAAVDGVDNEEAIYESHEANNELHDVLLDGGACGSLYNLAMELGLKVVRDFEVPRPIASNVKRLKVTKNKWDRIFEVKPSLLNRSGVEKAQQLVNEFGAI